MQIYNSSLIGDICDNPIVGLGTTGSKVLNQSFGGNYVGIERRLKLHLYRRQLRKNKNPLNVPRGLQSSELPHLARDVYYQDLFGNLAGSFAAPGGMPTGPPNLDLCQLGLGPQSGRYS